MRTDVRPHMIRADVDDNLWLVDDMANTVTKCDRSGQRLLVLRPKGVVLKEAAEMAATAGEIAEPPCVPGHSTLFIRSVDLRQDCCK